MIVMVSITQQDRIRFPRGGGGGSESEAAMEDDPMQLFLYTLPNEVAVDGGDWEADVLECLAAFNLSPETH